MQPDTRTLPLCVDLDGTLSRTNSIAEQIVALLRTRPWGIAPLVVALMRGRPAFKRALQRQSPIERISLPYHPAFVAYAEAEAARGREVMLVTAADQSTATHVASLFPFFKEGVGSTGDVNLSGRNKGEYLANRYGEKGFVYAGNEARDTRVWERAGGAIIVNQSPGLERAARKLTEIERVFEDRPSVLLAIARSLRPHHWLKNLLVFVPVVTSHAVGDAAVLVSALHAFVAFCLAASAAYVLNDLADLPSDRAHPTKRFRPFASGDLPVEWGMSLCPLLLVVAYAAVSVLPPAAHGALAAYVVLTLLYSFFFKRIFLLDAAVLALLFAIRIFMGHASAGIPYSIWLTSFVACMCLSLALLKRFSELHGRTGGYAPGRGYHVDHRAIIGPIGIACGVLAAAVIAAYAGSAHAASLYSRPQLLYVLCPIFLVWTLRMWSLGYRGKMHDDPLLFTMRDPPSVGVGVVAVALMLLAR